MKRNIVLGVILGTICQSVFAMPMKKGEFMSTSNRKNRVQREESNPKRYEKRMNEQQKNGLNNKMQDDKSRLYNNGLDNEQKRRNWTR